MSVRSVRMSFPSHHVPLVTILLMLVFISMIVYQFILLVETVPGNFLSTPPVYQIQRPTSSKTLVSQNTNPNPLDGCLHVYLDVGSNRGIQVRKLFEPNLFPRSRTFLNLIDKYFGERRNSSQVCAVGFEPNPVHEDHLLQTAAAYDKCGWRALFHTRTGVAKAEIFQHIFSWKPSL